MDSQGNLSNVSGVGPVQTVSDGSYSFTGLAAGTYQIQISPSSKLAVGTLSPGSAGGTAGSDEIQVTLAAGQNATDYNFAILGAQTNEISLRMFMSSTGSLTQFLTTHALQALRGTGDSSSRRRPRTPPAGRRWPSFPHRHDHRARQPHADVDDRDHREPPGRQQRDSCRPITTGTTLTSNYANGVLTVSGVADVATYQTVLHRCSTATRASPANVGDRTISITVNDGTATSTAATATISVVTRREYRPGRDHGADQSDGRRGRHGDLYRGGQRHIPRPPCNGRSTPAAAATPT